MQKLHSLFISGNCSTCFGWYFHPSSGAHTTVSTASYILSHSYCYLPLKWKSWNRFERAVGDVRKPQQAETGSNSSTIAADGSNVVTNTRCCRYSCTRSWWWVEVPPETCRTVSRYTASGICHTVTAICRYSGRVGTGLSVLWVAYTTHSTLKPVPTLPR